MAVRCAGAAKHMAGIAPAILLHSRHPWRSDVRERPRLAGHAQEPSRYGGRL